MSTKREIAELLAPYVIPFVGSSGGGKYAFQLLCCASACYRQDTVSAAKHNIGSERHKKKAAEKLAAMGWNFNGGPLCPDHAKQPPTN